MSLHATGVSLQADDAEILREAWVLASRLRGANVLWTGRTGPATGGGSDVLPHDVRALGGLARLLGYPPGSGAELEETFLRTARRARAVVERAFYA